MKVLNVSHNDLDGIGCNFILGACFGVKNIKIYNCSYNSINSTLYEIFKSGEIDHYDKLIITDISISENMANWIDNKYADKTILIDHHINDGTAHLAKYEWVHQSLNKDEIEELTSATYMSYKFFGLDKWDNVAIDQIVELIDRYDTWLWKTKYDYELPKDLNTLFSILGKERLLKYFHETVDNLYFFAIPKEYKLLLELKKEEYQRYFDNSERNLNVVEVETTNGTYQVGCVFAEQFKSELGNDIATLHPELDFVAIISLRSAISLRTVKDDIHVGNIATELANLNNCKGGGHAKAGGITPVRDFKQQIINLIMRGE